MASKVLEPDLILSPDRKRVLYASDFERLEREKRLVDSLTFFLADFLARTR